MLFLQQRFWPFGIAVAALAAAVALDTLLERTREPEPRRWLAGLLVTGLVIAGSVRDLKLAYPISGSHWFMVAQPIMADLRAACAESPGVVLADENYGHQITYYTECSVIANNFIIAPSDYEKIREVARLFDLSVPDFLAADAGVDYVLADVHPGRLAKLHETGRLGFGAETGALKRALLEQTKVTPAGLQLLSEKRTDVGPDTYATLRLFRVPR